MSDDLVTVKEAAKALRVNHTTVMRWIDLGILPAIRLPSKYGIRQHYRIRASVINELIKEGKISVENNQEAAN